MGIFDFISKQLVDVIDWTEQPGDLALRYPMSDREIQNGAQLTVRDGQVALFYDEGRVADAFQPGLHTLDTANLPRPDLAYVTGRPVRVAVQGRRLLLHARRSRPG